MENYSNIKLTKDENIWIIQLIRKDAACAIDRYTAKELVDCFKNFESDGTAYIAVLTGTGKYFCAGADLKQIKKGKVNKDLMNELEFNKDAPLGVTRMLLSKPVIAAINGYAVAGGLELALWCDLRVSHKNAIFGVLCRRYGVPLIDGGTFRLSALIGLSRAMDLILTGREISGKEGHIIGLINVITNEDNVLNESIKLAKKLARLPQQCLRNDRLSLLSNTYALQLDRYIKNEFEYGIKTINSGELFSGAEKFTKKIKPKF